MLVSGDDLEAVSLVLGQGSSPAWQTVVGAIDAARGRPLLASADAYQVLRLELATALQARDTAALIIHLQKMLEVVCSRSWVEYVGDLLHCAVVACLRYDMFDFAYLLGSRGGSCWSAHRAFLALVVGKTEEVEDSLEEAHRGGLQSLVALALAVYTCSDRETVAKLVQDALFQNPGPNSYRTEILRLQALSLVGTSEWHVANEMYKMTAEVPSEPLDVPNEQLHRLEGAVAQIIPMLEASFRWDPVEARWNRQRPL